MGPPQMSVSGLDYEMTMLIASSSSLAGSATLAVSRNSINYIVAHYRGFDIYTHLNVRLGRYVDQKKL
jgi:hypothetical protein